MSRARKVARPVIVRSAREGRKRSEGWRNAAVCGMTNRERSKTYIHVVAKTGEANQIIFPG